jgi:hypothetical protein
LVALLHDATALALLMGGTMHRIAYVVALVLGTAVPAHAVPCDAIAGRSEPVIYAQVGATQNALMRRLSHALADNASKKITLVWFESGSCPNINAIYTRVALAAGTKMKYAASSAENPDWTAATPTLECDVPAGGMVPDIANSALFNSACTTAPPPSTVKLTFGPVQAYDLVTPIASNQRAITYEEAYFVFGFGMGGMIEPWMNEAQLFITTVTKSTLLAWAANIGVPADKWKGIRLSDPTLAVPALQMTTSPQEAIAPMGDEIFEQNRATLSRLAFRARGQHAAYYPDSTYTSHDKKNIRDGHYTVWSPTVWMNKIDPTTHTPVNPDAQYVIDMIAGKQVTPAPNFDPNVNVARVGLVPDCAMRVARDFDGGPLRLYRPAESCTCTYEATVETTSCATCDASNPCATGVCRAGYCEEF